MSEASLSIESFLQCCNFSIGIHSLSSTGTKAGSSINSSPVRSGISVKRWLYAQLSYLGYPVSGQLILGPLQIQLNASSPDIALYIKNYYTPSFFFSIFTYLKSPFSITFPLPTTSRPLDHRLHSTGSKAAIPLTSHFML